MFERSRKIPIRQYFIDIFFDDRQHFPLPTEHITQDLIHRISSHKQHNQNSIMRISSATVYLVIATGSCASAFVPQAQPSSTTTSSSTSQLHASMLPPPFIIGPMIRKMREENEKKKMPMALAEEAANEAPGLRVGSKAWKWPPVWPYDDNTFIPKATIVKPDLAQVAGMMNGIPQVPVPEQEEDKFNPLKYWEEDVGNVPTELDANSVANLRNHYSFYIKDGMSVLELGAAEESYLPPGLKLARHVGVGAAKAAMSKNPSLTESLVVDLNDVEEDRGVNSEELKKLSSEPFDVIIMANTIDFLTNPREVFKSAWYLLKPGGSFIVSFSNKDAYTDKFGDAQTKMWQDYTDDQHIWCAGSFFQFSAGDGWENLRGFDISPEGAKSIDEQGPLSFLKGGENTNMFVVQATRAGQDESIDVENPEKSFKSKMWMLPTMENRDKKLVAPRLRRAYEQLPEPEFLAKQVELLPAIYESLIKMDQFAFNFNLQAQLAVDLVADPDFCAHEEQIKALKQGLGLRTPSEEFWVPIGKFTSSMEAEDKVNLLAHLVPRFGSNNPEQEACLVAFVDGLQPTYDYIRSQCPALPESDIQLLGTEVLAAEVLKPNRSSREEYAQWLGALKETELIQILEARKQIKLGAKQDLQAFRDAIEEAKRAETELMEQRKQQIEKARSERTLEFNVKTGSFEKAKKK